MGFISALNASKKASPSFPGMTQGQATWREVFGNTDKERPRAQTPPAGRGWGRSIAGAGQDAAVKRLIEAMRSRAPGGWTDDRYEQSRHFVGIAYVAIHRICTLWQRAEFQVSKKDHKHPDGKRPITREDLPERDRIVSPYDLVELLERPNKRDSFGKLMYRWGQQKYLTGQAITWMIPNELGTPMELYCLPTALAIPQPSINPLYPEGYYRMQPLYPYGPFSSYPTPSYSVGAPIDARWTLRFLYPHPLLHYEGYSPMTAMRLHMDSIEMVDRSRFSTMRREIRPSAVLNMGDVEVQGYSPLERAEIERIRAEFEEVLMGPDNAGNLFVSSPGCTLEPWGTSPLEMDFQQSWDQLCSFILGGFGITKPAAGMVEDSSYSTLFATLKQLYTLTLDPDFDDIASELTRHLAPYFGDDLIIEIRGKKIDDHDIRMALFDKMLMGKLGTVNDGLKLLEMPLTKEKWGNERLGVEAQPDKQLTGAMGESSDEGQEAPEQQAAEGPKPANPVPPDMRAKPKSETQATPEEAKAEPGEVASSRPKAGKLSEGSKGPQIKNLFHSRLLAKRRGLIQYKSLEVQQETKSFYDMVRETLTNGNGKHH